MENVRFCKKCENGVPDSAKYCPNCGNNLSNGIVSEKEIKESQYTNWKTKFGEEITRDKKGFVLVVTAFVFVIIALIGFCKCEFLPERNNSKESLVGTSGENTFIAESTDENSEHIEEQISNSFDDEKNENIEEAASDDQEEQNSIGIQKLSGSFSKLGLSESELKSRLGYQLDGPSDFYGDIMVKSFCIDNVDDMNCYLDTDMQEYYAAVDGKVVMFGANIGFDYFIKDFIKDGELSIEPVSYMVRGIDHGYMASYLWAIDNGYLSIIAMPSPGCDYYNFRVETITYVSDLKYLGYLNYNKMDIYNYGKVILD